MLLPTIRLQTRRAIASNTHKFSRPRLASRYPRGILKDSIRREAYSPKPAVFQQDFTSIGHASLMDMQKAGLKFFGLRFLSTSRWSEDNETKVEILSKQNIKPESPTPQHLRTYKVSILDQLNPHMYVPMIYFYQNTENVILSDAISEKRERLKQSLSQTLSRFYPLAGKVKDNLHIECSDEGVYYVEARISTHLSKFLSQPSSQLIHQLLPIHPGNSAELLSETYVAMVQVSIFQCGGIAIALYTTHKIIDGHSRLTFLKAWAATAQGSFHQIIPSYISPSLFVANPSMPEYMSLHFWPSEFKRVKKASRRFLFDASALNALKAKATTSSSTGTDNPSRVLAVMGLLWKCAASAFRARSNCERPFLFRTPVNLRSRISPPLPTNSIGNIFWVAAAQSSMDTNVELPSIVRTIKDAITRIDSDFVEGIKGEGGSVKVFEHWKELANTWSIVKPADSLMFSSLCNAGQYEADFGWGKPVWTCFGCPDLDSLAIRNFGFLFDTRSGDGIEVLLTMSEEDMTIFEQDPELLAFASINPSPPSILKIVSGFSFCVFMH